MRCGARGPVEGARNLPCTSSHVVSTLFYPVSPTSHGQQFLFIPLCQFTYPNSA